MASHSTKQHLQQGDEYRDGKDCIPVPASTTGHPDTSRKSGPGRDGDEALHTRDQHQDPFQHR